MKCSFCNSPRVESYIAEAGNNAETDVVVDLCEEHLEEMEASADAFDKKYADKINGMAAQQ